MTNLRIISICPSNTELLDALGLIDAVVGVDDYSDWPAEKVQHLPKLGPDLNINMERLVELKPDLVIASLSVPGMEKNVERLQELNIPHLVLNPKTIEEIYGDIVTLAEACGVPERAQRVVTELQAKVQRVQEKAAARKHSPKLYWEWWPRPIFTPGALNWLTPISELVGGVNLFADQPGDSYTATHEEVIERAPDYMFAVWCGVHADKVKTSMITDRVGYAAIPAVQNGRVYVLEEGLYCRPSQRLFQGLEELVELLYPELS
ncbi:cobalamin-binding protein [Tumebacillus avium]|uniref:Cobalamin-binding protein n=1 Tax=Tumebacillus avium TaxID=1903704 RepID=A0A1Y0IRZ3_9BACL|nr:cobalamin-binding protein [Tumebacillus avium]ARU63412.1 cobalamin-binding protein [Tumebacillus avium]